MSKKKKQNLPSEEDLVIVKQLLDSAENQIRKAKSLIFSLEVEEKAREVLAISNCDGSIIEGVFDGENFVADGKKYPVPANYASKSKLVCGDILKLTILPDGSFVYKQISPVERQKIIGDLEEFAGGFRINVSGELYNVLTASVTYFKALPGDKITALIPADGKSDWAAVENKIIE